MPLEEQLAQSRDRITDLLTRKKPELGDIASAFLRSSGGQSTYGEELNRMKAGRLAEQKTLFDVLSGHKKMKQADRQLGAAESKNAWDRIQAARKQGVEDAKAVGDSIERYVVNDADRQTVANYLSESQEQVTALNADTSVARAVGELASTGKITQKKPEKALTAQSPEGKLIQDRELFRETFGENSEQVNAFDELIEAGDEPDAPKLTDERGMRQEFTKLSAPFVGVQDSFRKVKASAALGTAVGDISLIFAYMKMLDQESVVREGEQATAESARGVPAGIRNFYNKLLTGEKLPPEQKAQFVEAAKALFQIESESQRNLVQRFIHIANISKIDSAKVVIDFFLESGSDEPADPIDALLDQLETQTR